MGWGNCGTDSKGRPIGYLFDAKCDHPGCNADIHRGLAYACGGMHGEDEFSCEGYFCPEHLTTPEAESDCRSFVCFACAAIWDAENSPPVPTLSLSGKT